MKPLKWFTKRATLQSNDRMPVAISSVLVGFIEKMKSEGKINRWYTSLKNDDKIPSFRVYLEIDENDEQAIKLALDRFLQRSADQIGWTGKYCEPNPEFNPSHPHLDAVILACETVLKLVTSFPKIDRIANPRFWNEVRNEINLCLREMDPTHHGEFIHFIANNLGFSDDSFLCKFRT